MNVKRRKSREEDEEGAICNLPEELLCHILSFLPTKEAALTSVLSKRWRDLFTLIPSLDLVGSISSKQPSFIKFVNRVFALQSNSPMAKFSLICHTIVKQKIVEDWVAKALRRGATDLTLIYLSLPSSIFFHSQNLVKLKLGCGDLCFFNILAQGNIIFTKLKTLHLNSIKIGGNGVKLSLLMSKCPVLEELIVVCIKWHRSSSASVSSSTLKRLTIDGDQSLSESFCPLFEYTNFGSASPHDVSFDTPNLLYLNYADFVARNYPLVKFDSLVEAKLDVGSTKDQMRAKDPNTGYDIPWDITNLIMGLHNVQILHLTSSTLEVIAYFCKTLPLFHNLNRLSIASDFDRGWEVLPRLLNNSPNLHTLVFHGLHHSVTDHCGDVCDCISSSVSCLSCCRVKILKILDFGASCREMSLVKNFLNKLSHLEEVTIVLLDFGFPLEEDDLSQVSSPLEMVPRASPNCKLKVVSHN